MISRRNRAAPRLVAAASSSLCALSIGTSAAIAQNAPAAGQASGTAERSSVALEEIVVQARRTEENLENVPIALTVITPQTLLDKPIVTAQDFQYVTPGLVANASPRSDDNVRFTIRGQSQADMILTTDSSNGIYIDGVYQARTYGSKVGLFDLDHVEILKGPQGTLYGKNTTGGAVSIFTRKPELDEFGGFVDVGAGSFDNASSLTSTNVKGALNAPFAEGVAAARLSFNFDKTDGYASELNGSRLTDHENLGLRLQGLIRPTDSLAIRISGSYVDIDGGGPLVKPVQVLPGAAMIDAGLQLGFPPQTAAAQGLAFVSAENAAAGPFTTGSTRPPIAFYEGWDSSIAIDWDVSSGLTLKSLTAYKDFRRGLHNDLDGTRLTLFHTATDTQATFFSQEFQGVGTALQGALSYVGGLYYSDEDGHEGSNNQILPTLTGGVTTVFDGDIRNKSWGAFAQSVYNFLERWSVTGGVRYSEDERGLVSRNRNETASGGFVSCSLPGGPPANQCSLDAGDLKFSDTSYTFSLGYAAGDNVNLYVTTRNGYRAGGWNATVVGGNFVPYEPETVTDYEIGAKTQLFDRRLRLNIAAYQSDYQDIQKTALVIFPGPPPTQGAVINNAATATIRGVELDFVGAPASALRLDGTVAYTDAAYDDFNVNTLTGPVDRSDEPFEVPEWTYSLGAKYTWELPVGEFSARLDWFWRSEVIFTAASALTSSEAILRQDDYGLLSARLEWAIPERGMTFAVVGRNLTDEYYYISGLDARALGFGLLQPGEPRFIGVQLIKSFGGE